MTHLLDTNICIAHLRPRTQQTILSRIDAVGVMNVVVCSIVRAELLAGALKSDRPAIERAKVERFLSSFDSLPFDDAAAEHYAKVRVPLEAQGQVIGANDLLIASIALAHGLTLVTHNSGEFARVPGLEVEDWLGQS